MSRRSFCLVVGAAVLLAACARASATDTTPLGTLIRGLRPLQSGHLDFGLHFSSGSSATAGFEVAGAFADPRGSERVPVLDLTLAESGQPAPVRVVSDGEHVERVSGGGAVSVDPASIGRTGPGQDLTGVQQLGIARWAAGPQNESSLAVGGVQELQVSSGADPVRAIDGIVELSQEVASASGALQPVPKDQQDALRRELRSSRLVVTAGAQDHLLRGVHLELDFAPSSQAQLRSALGAIADVRMTLDVSIEDPNQPVRAPTLAG